MKNRFRLLTTVLLVLVGIIGSQARHEHGVQAEEQSQATDVRLPALQGTAALNALKEQGLYKSLTEAIKATTQDVQPNALIGQQNKLVANDGSANDKFGEAIAVSSNTVVVGARYDAVSAPNQGSVYIFVRNGTTWTQQARLNATDGADSDHFGTSVAISGDTVIVGSPNDDIGANQNQGSAYVFVRDGASWSQQQKLVAVDGMTNDLFGTAVAINNDTLLLGTPQNAGKGAAYVFIRNGAIWVQQQKLIGADTSTGDSFGASVTLTDETAAIGALNDRSGGATAQHGSVYVFVRNVATWNQQQKLLPFSTTVQAHFGNAVSLSGNTLAVGAREDTVNGNPNQGAAYVFIRNGSTWTIQTRITLVNGKAQERVGYSVALNGDILVVGNPDGDVGGNTNQGAIYVYARVGTNWNMYQHLTVSDGTAYDYFGSSVAIVGDTLLVGAYGKDIGTNYSQGAVYSFVIGGDLIERQKLNEPDSGHYFSFSVAVDGDTVVIGAPNFGGTGTAFVYMRNGANWSLQQQLLASDRAPGDYFGSAVAITGDTIAVGASFDDVGSHEGQGSVYIFNRSGESWIQQQKLSEGLFGAAYDSFGYSTSFDHDTLAIGAPNAGNGAVYVFVRNGTTWNYQQRLTASDGAVDDFFGWYVDIDGDTLVVGAPYDDISANNNQGSAYVFVRNGSTWSQQQKLIASDGSATDFFGGGVGISGETVIVGSGASNIGVNQDQGAAYIFVRSGSIWSQQQKLTASDGQANSVFGVSVALDGSTAVVGAYSDTIGGKYGQGSIYVFSRRGAIWSERQKLVASDGAYGDSFGWRLALNGDVVVVSALHDDYSVNNPTSGSAYVFTSGACPATTFNPLTLPNAAVGISYNQTITATGNQASYNFSITSGALPSGITLSPAGFLSGIAATAGTYNFTVTATASNLCPGSWNYTLTVNGSCPAITVNPASLPNGTQGTTYNQTLTASGGAAPYSYIVSAGALPGGLSLAANGTLTGPLTASGTFNFTVKATDANGCFGTRAYTVTVNGGGGNPSGLQFYPLPKPIRLFDTRAAIPGYPACQYLGQSLVANGELVRNAHLTCDGSVIPANAAAIVGTATVINPANNGYITLWPDGQQRPPVSNLNFTTGQSVANAITVGLSGAGDFRIYSPAGTDLVVDVTGYYAPPSASGLYYHPLPKPIRLFDTRSPIQGFPACEYLSQPLAAGIELVKQARISCDGLTIPADAMAIVGNATAVSPSGSGFVTMWQNGIARPNVSNLSYAAGQIVPDAFTIGLGGDGQFRVYSAANTNFIVDITGYYSPSANDINGNGLLYSPLPKPIRLFDTRAAIPGFPACEYLNQPLMANSELVKSGYIDCNGVTIPTNAEAIVGNATVVNPSGAGYITLWPDGQTRPPVSNLNHVAGQTVPNAFTVGLSGFGGFRIYSFATTDFIVDVTGFFAP